MVIKRTAYLASPIDKSIDVQYELVRERADARAVLSGAGFSVFDPSTAWTVPVRFEDEPIDLPESIQVVNNKALLASDVVLAILPPDVKTTGVPFEIGLAIAHDIPVYVATTEIPTALRGSGIRFYDRAIEAADAIKTTRYTSNLTSALLFQTEEGAEKPTRAYTGDAGYDLYVSERTEIPPGKVVDVPSGVAVAIPIGHYGRIVGRSSTHRKRGLSVVEGIIDAGYRGPLFSCVWNPSTTDTVVLDVGERVAQLIVTPVSDLTAVHTDTLPPSERGDRGFGSSGMGKEGAR